MTQSQTVIVLRWCEAVNREPDWLLNALPSGAFAQLQATYSLLPHAQQTARVCFLAPEIPPSSSPSLRP